MRANSAAYLQSTHGVALVLVAPDVHARAAVLRLAAAYVIRPAELLLGLLLCVRRRERPPGLVLFLKSGRLLRLLQAPADVLEAGEHEEDAHRAEGDDGQHLVGHGECFQQLTVLWMSVEEGEQLRANSAATYLFDCMLKMTVTT